MLALINSFLKVIPPILMATLVGVFVAGFLFQSWRLDSAHEKLGAATAAVDQCAGVNAKNVGVVKDLRDAAQACVAGREADEKQFAAVQLEWVEERGVLRQVAQEVRVEEIEIYRDPTCADFATLDIGSVCPGLVVQLRQRAARRHGIRDGGESSDGAGAGP